MPVASSTRRADQVSGGLHGVGVSVVNALSNWLSAHVYRDGNIYEMRFSKGLMTSPLSTRQESLNDLLARYQQWYGAPAPFTRVAGTRSKPLHPVRRILLQHWRSIQ